jgi:hypothetical protein
MAQNPAYRPPDASISCEIPNAARGINQLFFVCSILLRRNVLRFYLATPVKTVLDTGFGIVSHDFP